MCRKVDHVRFGRFVQAINVRESLNAALCGDRVAATTPKQPRNLPMLTISDLTHTYPDGTRALNGVDLEIGPGMFGLLGPNGAGKSSLMRSIATLQTPTSGSIAFDGIDVIAEPERLRQKLGYLPQDFGVYPRVCAYDLLDHIATLKGLVSRKARAETVETLLAQTNLWEARKQAVAGFSGGMRRRFGIAQALIGDPSLIIVDEPTAGLDPEERNRFLNLLSGIGEQVVVVLSTHLVDDVADLCPKMAILAQGRITLTGDPRELIARCAGSVWEKEVSREELAELTERCQVLSTRLRAGKVVVHLLSEEDPGDDFRAIPGGLEDVYFISLAESSHGASQGGAR